MEGLMELLMKIKTLQEQNDRVERDKSSLQQAIAKKVNIIVAIIYQ